MQRPPLSQTQGCLRLQSVYRAHRTRRCVLHRSRSEFERILIDLEPESNRSRVLFPHPFMCRPQIERSAPATAIAMESTTNHASPLLVSLSSSAAPSVCSSPLHVANCNSHASTGSSRVVSPSPSAPDSPSASRVTRNFSAVATAAANVLPAVIPSSACIGDGSNMPSLQLSAHNQQQHIELRSSSFCDAAVQSMPLSLSSTTADACVGDDDHLPSTSFQEHGGHNSRGCVRGHDDSLDDDGRLRESNCNSSFSEGSCEASQSFNSVPPYPSAEQVHCSEHRFLSFLSPPLALKYPSPLTTCCSNASPRTFGMHLDQQTSSSSSNSHRSSSSVQDDQNSVICHRVSITADSRFLHATPVQLSCFSPHHSFDSNHFPSPPPSPPASHRQPPSPLSLDALSPLPPPPHSLESSALLSPVEMVGGLSPQTSHADLDRSSSSIVSNSSKRSLDAIMAASSLSASCAMPLSPAATATNFDPSLLFNPPLSPAAAASLSPLEKVSMKQKLEKDLEWTQLMLQQRLLFLKQQQQKTPQ